MTSATTSGWLRWRASTCGLGPAVLVPLGPPGNVRGVLTAGRHRGSLPLSPPAVEMLITFAAQAGHRAGAGRAPQGRPAAGPVRGPGPDRPRLARPGDPAAVRHRDVAAGQLGADRRSGGGEPGPAGGRRPGRDDQGYPVGDLHPAVAPAGRSGRDPDQDPGRGGGDDRVARLRAVGADGRTARRAGTRRDSRSACWRCCARRCPTWPGTPAPAGSSVAVTAGSDLTLTVRDDGTGMKASSRRSGLANLADRASQLGGTLRVGPRRGRRHRARVARPATSGRSGG